jgi:methyl-accepting chemotaxis protein
MNLLNNMKTSVKLISSFMVIAVLTAAVGALGIIYIRQIDAAGTQLYQHQTVPIGQLQDMSVSFQRIRVNMRDLLLVKTPEEMQEHVDTIEQLTKEIDKVEAEYEALIVTQEMQSLFDAYSASYEQFLPYVDQITSLALDGKQEQGLIILRGDAYTAAKEIEADIDAMVAMKVKQAQETADENSATAAQASTVMIIIAIIAALMAMGFGVVISSSIASPLGMLTKMAKALAVGDMLRETSDAEKDKVRLRKDEIGDIGKAFDNLIDYMQNMGFAATAIADNDLTTTVTPKSAKDELGNSFAKMIVGLRDAVGRGSGKRKRSLCRLCPAGICF